MSTSQPPQAAHSWDRQYPARGRYRNTNQRGAVFVEALVVIAFMLLMWQLMWMVLSHYQAKQHAAQQARQDVWQWGMRDQCANDKAPKSRDPNAKRDPPSDFDDAISAKPDPCKGAPGCKVEKDTSGESLNGTNVGANDIPLFQQKTQTKSNLAIITVQQSYYSYVSRQNEAVPVQLSIECNPKMQTKESPLVGIAKRLFSTVKSVL